MQNQTAPRPHGVPEEFYRKFGRDVTAVLSGFDRMRFRGTLRMLFNPAKMDLYLGCCGVLLKDFGSFAEQLTAKVKEAARAAAQRLSRPIEYLNSPAISKEELARQIAQRDHLRSGLIALFMALEPCLSYAIRKDRARQQIKLVLETEQMHPSLSLLPASGVWCNAPAGAKLVSFHGRYLSECPPLVGPPNGSGRAELPAAGQLFYLTSRSSGRPSFTG
jgi:hypothetical protein